MGSGRRPFKFRPPRFRPPSIKDDATHGEESGGEGNARAAQSVQCTTADEPDQNRCEERAQFSSTAPRQEPPSPPPSDFPVRRPRGGDESRADVRREGGAGGVG